MNPEQSIQLAVDRNLTQFRHSQIRYFPYLSGATDVYKQKAKQFGVPTPLIGRAILNPTKEQVSVIGNDEVYEIAFLFSRLEMIRKFPLANEGEWLDVTGQIEWYDRRFKIEKYQQSGQVGPDFSLVIALGNSLLGQRDP